MGKRRGGNGQGGKCFPEWDKVRVSHYQHLLINDRRIMMRLRKVAGGRRALYVWTNV